ncbi:MAG: dTMP kinase [Planctomycetaceae bacterium]|jgi:dTMP kinase|nr:dTMP kinase [Planctomycetaceae bacterium]
MFITLDGGDGCGKSTQIHLLAEKLQSQGHEVVCCRDPGSTQLGDAVRNILLNRQELSIADMTEMFLFMAARSQLLHEVIRPALATGKIVLSDRFLISTFVYQCHAGGVPADVLQFISAAVVGETLPDLGIILDIPYESAIQRVGSRAVPDRMECKGEEYHRRVREGFLKYAAAEPERYVVIDATPSPEEVADAIWQIVSDKTIRKCQVIGGAQYRRAT